MNVKKSIAKYILTECLEVSLNELFERFQVEYEYPYNLKLFPNRMVRLSEYLAGLPSTISIPCYYYEIRELVLKFEPEASERTLERWENNFFKIVADILLTEYNKTNGKAL